MTSRLAKRLLEIGPDMIQELATGVEDGEVIARRYGYSKDEWEAISKVPEFRARVEHAIAERAKSGQTFRLKAALMAEKLMDDMFSSALGSEVPVKDKAAALQVLTRVGELEPRKDAGPAATGPAFSISISLPEGFTAQRTATVDAVVSEDKKPDFAGISLTLPEDD